MMLLSILLPLAGALAIWCVPAGNRRALNAYTVLVLAASAACCAAVALGADRTVTVWRLTDNLSIALRNDGVSRLYLAFISIVWVAVGVYAIGYNAHDPNPRRFDCFYIGTYGVLAGLSMSDNAVTLYMFYEMMTLITLPLVMHTMEKEAVAAGIKYLVYSVFGASTALLGIFFLAHYGTTLTFTPGGVLDMARVAGHEGLLRAIAFAMILGFGVKAA